MYNIKLSFTIDCEAPYSLYSIPGITVPLSQNWYRNSWVTIDWEAPFTLYSIPGITVPLFQNWYRNTWVTIDWEAPSTLYSIPGITVPLFQNWYRNTWVTIDWEAYFYCSEFKGILREHSQCENFNDWLNSTKNDYSSWMWRNCIKVQTLTNSTAQSLKE